MFLMMTEGYDGDCARKERMREDRKKKEIRTPYGNEVVRDFFAANRAFNTELDSWLHSV